ncbi:MAG: hypothetical protein KJ787_04270 [Gammaproteobacteria bacterium]|nr:hypothetical protein [Gammaproteobacteria bacterium]MBU1645527.1 hypothetical protein [Gammaproteobacteria bacterium]MBU1973671.1 hypothetical protein [Gammaproteobacteria bacterium]
MTDTFNLPETSTAQPPAFTTAAGCRTWLAEQPVTNAVQMQAILLRQLNQLNRYALPATERLAIMELLREPVHASQDENSRRFAGKPLPLGPTEQAAYDTCQSIWNALATGYQHCLAACIDDEAGMKPQWPLVAQRTLAALVSVLFDTYRGGRQPPAGYWKSLHRTYAAAENAGVARQEVADNVRLGKNLAAPLATWIEGLLLHAASPYQLPPKQIGWAARWARRWAGKLSVSETPPTLSARTIPLCVDLDADAPAGYRPIFVPGTRFVDTSGMRDSLKKRVVRLERGDSPRDLQLGDDCTQPLCQELLIQMYYRWCKGGAIRKHERRAADGNCVIIGGIEAIHYYVSGRKAFQQPGGSLSDTQIRRQRDEIATFGRVMETPQADDYSQQHGFQVEQWEVMEEWRMLDQSATGVRIQRPLASAGSRFGGGQLVAVRPKDVRSLLLGTLRWAMIDGKDALQAGVQIIAGQPQPVAVRGTGLSAVREKYSPGFLLPAVAALHEPESIVFPVGWFKRERVLEIYSGKSTQLRLTGLIERGNDFERATYDRI